MGESSAGWEKSARRALYAVLASICLLSGGWVTATASMAATCSGPSCDNVGRVLEALDAARGDLSVEIVDHISSGVENSGASAPTLAESMAPLLYLTPRVTTILQDVFGDSEQSDIVFPAGQAGEKVDDPATVAGGEENDLPATPVAGTADRSNPDLYGPLSVLDNAANLPKFQRQMYRTDI